MNTQKINKKSAGAFLALALLLSGGSFGIMLSANNVEAQITRSNTNIEQEPQLNGSIRVVEDESLSENDESIQYAQLAKVTEAAAITVAEAKIGGRATDVELEDENGSLIYEVTVGTEKVLVDAGNGTILMVESDNEPYEDKGYEKREEEYEVML